MKILYEFQEDIRTFLLSLSIETTVHVLTSGRRNGLNWFQMKLKMDDIQEREADACGMTLLFDNDVDISSKNSGKCGQSHRKSVLSTIRKTAHSEKISNCTYNSWESLLRVLYSPMRKPEDSFSMWNRQSRQNRWTYVTRETWKRRRLER